MRVLSILLIPFLAVLCMGCNEDGGNEPIPHLAGIIGGESWEYKYVKSNFNSLDNVYDAEVFGEQQSENDPCSIFISGEAHLAIQVPSTPGTYFIPSDINLIFEQSGVDNTSFTATSGTVEVVGVLDGIVSVYIQADYDESNHVEGSVQFRKCN
ncbi:MAG: hypothetical protein JXQ90_12640 [Cyclobacteriaceae bacterium]